MLKITGIGHKVEVWARGMYFNIGINFNKEVGDDGCSHQRGGTTK